MSHLYTAAILCCIILAGEQLPLLARGGRGGDDMWEAEGEAGTSQWLWGHRRKKD